MGNFYWLCSLVISLAFLNGCSSDQPQERTQRTDSLISVEEIETLVERIPDEGNSSVPFRQLFQEDRPQVALEPTEREVVQDIAPAVSRLTPRVVSEPPRLVGVNLRLGRAEAYFVEGEKMHVARVGDIVSRNYRILAIFAEEVRVRDLSSGLQRRIEIKANE